MVQPDREDLSSMMRAKKANNKVVKEAWNHLVRSDLRHSDFSRKSSTFQLFNGKLVVVFDIKDNKVRSESDKVIVSRFAVVYVNQAAEDRIRILDATFVHGWPGRDPADIVPFALSDDERIFREWYTVEEFNELSDRTMVVSVKNGDAPDGVEEAVGAKTGSSSATASKSSGYDTCVVADYYVNGVHVARTVLYCYCSRALSCGGAGFGGGTGYEVSEEVDFSQFTVEGDVFGKSTISLYPDLEQCEPKGESLTELANREMTGTAEYKVEPEGYTNLDLSFIEAAIQRLGSGVNHPDYTTSAKLRGMVSGPGAPGMMLSDDDYRYAHDKATYRYSHDVSTGVYHILDGNHEGEVRAGGQGDIEGVPSSHWWTFEKWTCAKVIGQMNWSE